MVGMRINADKKRYLVCNWHNIDVIKQDVFAHTEQNPSFCKLFITFDDAIIGNFSAAVSSLPVNSEAMHNPL